MTPIPNHAALVGKPSAETAVYLLLGMLWDHLPVTLTFEEFEVSPRKQKYDHTKCLDARGKELIDGEWVDVNFEFKLKSSGVLSDLKKHPDFHATWLVCWEHDAPAAERYVDRVLCLEQIYNALPEERKQRLIMSPDRLMKDLPGVKTPFQELVERFSAANRDRVDRIIDRWPFQRQCTTSELVFTKGGLTYMRLVANWSEHLLIKAQLPVELRYELITRYGAEEMEVNDKLKIHLHRLDPAGVDKIMDAVLAAAGQCAVNHQRKTTQARAEKQDGRKGTAPVGTDTDKIVKKFNPLGVSRKSDEPGTPVTIKWQYETHVVILRYQYKMGWGFDGFELDGEFVADKRGFPSRDSARDYYLAEAWKRISDRQR